MILSDIPTVNAFFLEYGSNSLFALYYQPAEQKVNESILLVPPFADEMNKSRRMISLQANIFCKQGYSVLILDLYGTGDSSGDFSNATWQMWRENLYLGWSFLQEKGHRSIHLWGIRLGTLLALDAAIFFNWSVEKFLLWQPVINGDRYLTQLLRLRIAEQFGRNSQETVKNLRERSIEGEPLEIAGYLMRAEMLNYIASLNAADLTPVGPASVIWLECFSAELPELLPASKKIIKEWRTENLFVKAASLKGKQFWNSVEIEEVDELLEQSLIFFKGLNHASP